MKKYYSSWWKKHKFFNFILYISKYILISFAIHDKAKKTFHRLGIDPMIKRKHFIEKLVIFFRIRLYPFCFLMFLSPIFKKKLWQTLSLTSLGEKSWVNPMESLLSDQPSWTFSFETSVNALHFHDAESKKINYEH